MKIPINGVQIKRKVFIEDEFLEVKERGIAVIKGKNGVGKTLLLKKIFYLLRRQGTRAIFVEQSNDYVIDSYSIVENIVLSDIYEETIKGRNFLEASDMEFLINCESGHLSGGEKRLVTLLRGLYKLGRNNGVIIIDEPTNDLDFDNVKRVIELLRKIADNHLVILTSHDDRILAISKEVFVIRNNHIEREKNVSV